MKQPHLLRFEGGAEEVAALVAALAERGERAGWLELEAPAPISESLETAAQAGVLRAVAVGGGRSVALKPMRGEPVLYDVLREHFRGCRAVFVRGAIAVPKLAARDGGWAVTTPEGKERVYTSEELASVLGRPRPWD